MTNPSNWLQIGPIMVVTLATTIIGLGAGAASANTMGHVAVSVNMPVSALNFEVGPANNSPEIIADPKDPQFVVLANRIDGPKFGCNLSVSVDGGQLWAPARPVPVLPAGAQECYAPQIAFGRNGVLYLAFAGLAGTGNAPIGEFLTSSSNYAHGFTAPRKILGPEKYMVSLAMDQSSGREGRLHLAWVSPSSPAPLDGFSPGTNPILADYSDDGGRTFSSPVQVSDPARQRVLAPAMVVGPDHSVDVLYYDLGKDSRDYEGLAGPTWPGNWSLVLARSANAGASFGTGVGVDDEIVPAGRVSLIYTMAPAALAVSQGGSLYAAWADARYGSADILFRRSLDAGRSWGPTLRLNHDPVTDGATHSLPELSVAPDGRIDAIFLDRRKDPKDIYNDTYYTDSTDGGTSFAPDARLSTKSSDSLVGQHYTNPSAAGLVEFGSRLGLLSTDSGALAAWTDTRNSISNPLGPGGPIAQDIFSAEIELPGQERFNPIWWVVIGAGVLVLASAGAAVVLGRGKRRRAALRAQSATDGSMLSGERMEQPDEHVPIMLEHRRDRRGFQVVASVVLLGAVGGTSWALSRGSSATPTVTAPVPISVVNLVMTDYKFSYVAPPTPGRIVFMVHNAGLLPHQLTLEELPLHFPLTINQQVHGKVRRAFPGIAYLPDLQPDQSTVFAVDLPAGRFAIVSFTRSHGQYDALRGMSSEFLVSQ
ncbi:MAG: sialidase family protein [Acidimicrobiales bacterium]